MEYFLHRDFSEIPAPSWNALAEAGISDTPFARHEYLHQWWQTLGGGEWQQAEMVLISASEGGRLIGVAPLFKSRHDGREVLLLIGSIEISDYLDLIVRPADAGRFVSGLLDFLSRSIGLRGMPLDWYNLPDASPTLAALQAESGKRNLTFQQKIFRPTPRIALAGNFDAYLAGLEKKQRHEIRRKLRRAAESRLPVRFYVVEDAASLESEMEALFDIMTQDADKAEFLRPAVREHMLSIARQALANGYLRLTFLTVDGAKAAGALNFDYRNKLWGYNSGVSRAQADLSPGWVLLAYELQWACEHGRYEFDFMRGDEEYKYRFGAVNKYVVRARLAAP